MSNITILRQIINNGWTIANRKNIVSKIGNNTFKEIIQLAQKSGRSGNTIKYNDAKDYLLPNTLASTKEILTKTNVAWHGSPFSFDFFDITKIGNGEGMNKYCNGLYLSRTKRIAPFYANIRSKDAPIHFGSAKPLGNSAPTVYKVENIDNLNLKLCTTLEAKKLKKVQAEFQRQHPEIDGIELLNGEITVFPESVYKLNITDKKDVVEFVKMNKEYPFREWTTDLEKINSI